MTGFRELQSVEPDAVGKRGEIPPRVQGIIVA